MKKKAVILLSGGLDSTTCLALAKKESFELFALTINYGQRHDFELNASKIIANLYNVKKHSILDINLAKFGGSALTDDIEVPKNRSENEMSNIPVTYVPARNTVFLSLALAWAESLKAYNIFIGVNSLDYSGYPDCRPAFIEQFERLANVATAAVDDGDRWSVEAPLMTMSKSDIVAAGTSLGIDYGLTVSCYQADENGAACGACDACRLRRKGFMDAGLPDPTYYQNGISPKI